MSIPNYKNICKSLLLLALLLPGDQVRGEERKFAVMLAVPRKSMPGYPGAPLPNPNDIYDHYFDTTKPGVDSFAEYWDEISYGNVHVTGNVLGWVEVPWPILPKVADGKRIPTVDLNDNKVFDMFAGETYNESRHQMYRSDCNPALPETCALDDDWWTPGERFMDLDEDGAYDGVIEPTADGFAAIITAGNPDADPPVEPVCDATEPDGKIESTNEFCDLDGDGIWDVPEPFEDFLRIYEPESRKWVKLDPSPKNTNAENRAWAEAYIRANYPGNADALIARCGNGRYDGPDPWIERGNTKVIAKLGSGVCPCAQPEGGVHPWNYAQQVVPNQPVWWEEYWKDMHRVAGVDNPPPAPPAPEWIARPGIEEFDPADADRPFEPNVGGTLARSTASCTPDPSIKDCNKSASPPATGSSGNGSLSGGHLIHTGGTVYPDAVGGFYDGPAEFSDMPSSIYHTQQAMENGVVVGPWSGIGYGGDGRFGEVTSPTSDAPSGEDTSPGDPSIPGGPDRRYAAAGPLAYNIHGTNGYDAGNVMPLEFSTWIHEPAYGETDVQYETLNADGTPNPGILKRDYNLDGLIDQGEVRLPGTENYVYDADSFLPNDGGPGEAYPFNRRRLTEDVIEALDSGVDWDHLLTTYGSRKYLFSTVLLPAGIYPDGMALGGRGLFQLPAPAMDLPVTTRDQTLLEGPMWCSDYATALDSTGDTGKNTAGFQKGLMAHEFLHVWEGYPDLYDYDEYINGYINNPVGIWDIMSGALVHPCPLLKEFATGAHGLGMFHAPWIQATDLRTVLQPLEKKTIVLTDYAFDPEKAAYYYENSADPGERFYFWRLTRQQPADPGKVNFSKALPGDGMMIMHTDAQQNLEGMPVQNRLSTHFTYNILQADGLQQLDNGENSGDAGDPWFGRTADQPAPSSPLWNSNTDPNSRWWRNTPSGVSIVDCEYKPNVSLVTFLWEPRLVPELKFLRPPGGTVTNGKFNLSYEAFDLFGGTQIEFYVERDNQGYEGTLINAFPLAKSIPDVIRSTYPVPLAALPGDGTCFFYARLVPGKGIDSQQEPAASIPDASTSNRGRGYLANGAGQPNAVDVDIARSFLEAWNVTCVDAQVPGQELWQVKGTVSGTLPELAQTGVKYTPASGQISFTIMWEGQAGNATVSNEDGVFTLEDTSVSQLFTTDRFRAFDVVRIESGPAPGLYPIKGVISPTKLELTADPGNGAASYRLHSFKAEDSFGPPDQFLFLTTGKTPYSRPIRIEHGKIVPELYAIITTAFRDEASNPLHRAPVTVLFDASQSRDELGNENEALTYLWDFGDGTTSTEKIVEHTYTRPYPDGVTVTLTVTNPAPFDDPTDFEPPPEFLTTTSTTKLMIPPLADNLAVVFEQDPMPVPEGATAEMRIKLSAAPPRNVTVTAAVEEGQRGKISVVPPGSVNFTGTNWDTWQVITLGAEEDVDASNHEAMIRCSVAGLFDQFVTAVEQDNDVQTIVAEQDPVMVPEGGTSDLRVKLSAEPDGPVVVDIVVSAGTSHISLGAVSTLTFTPADWDVFQPVQLVAAEDLDASNRSATVELRSAGLSDLLVTAVEVDNDVQQIVFDRSIVMVVEGGTADVNVKLSAEPDADVTVTATRVSGDPDLQVKSGGVFTFTSENWDVYQTMSFQASEDADAANGTATYDFASDVAPQDATLTLLEQDNDTLAIAVLNSPVTVPESGSAPMQLVLTAQPLANTTVQVTRVSGDQDITIQGPSSVTFTTANWNVPQSVMLAAAEDVDASNRTATLRCSAPGLPNAQATAVEQDNDVQAIIADQSRITVGEDGKAPLRIKLSAAPDANLVVTTARASGDSDIVVESGATLTFTPENWNSYQLLTIAARRDTDRLNGQAVIRSTAAGALPCDVTATELDNTPLTVMVDRTSIVVPEGASASVGVKLNAEPDADLSVAIERVDGNDTSLTASPVVLQFNRQNWNTPQTVTVAAAEDPDGSNGTAFFRCVAPQAYQASFSATEQDNDSQQILLETTELTVPEGGSAQVRVRLSVQPEADILLAVIPGAGDHDIQPGVSSLRFTTANWGVWQYVKISAVEDDDAGNGSNVIVFRADGLADASLSVTEQDNDRQQILCPSVVTIPENSSMTIAVTLLAQPTDDLTVSVEVASGDQDISVIGGDKLTFTASNWHINHIVTLATADDADKVDGEAVIRLSAAGLGVQTIRCTERDNDPNTAPVARAAAVTVPHASAQTILLEAEDADHYPRSLWYSIVDKPDHGQITHLDPEWGELIYVPQSGYAGSDSFTFKVNDSLADSPVATVSIIVQAAPIIDDEEPPVDDDTEPPGDDDDDDTGDDDSDDDDSASPNPDQRGDTDEDDDPQPVVTAPMPCGAGVVTSVTMIFAGLACPRMLRRRGAGGRQ